MQDTLEALREANGIRAAEWQAGGVDKTPETDAELNAEMLFRSNELGGECGEAQGAIKRLSRTLNGWRGGWSKEKAIANLRQELADVVICADRLAELFEIDLRAEIPAKFNETSEKNGLKTRMQPQTATKETCRNRHCELGFPIPFPCASCAMGPCKFGIENPD